ncbi:hypothetical protein UFOVP965_97 [uncultured Caudovirales phage]|uniref:VWFA domain containing protein n=1 Tax=uncultured Caudovirales phage TaxID=2100421 RepID=A0A6J5QY59_9CAUD|nr:hypothetical protein UFOVP965_97 [uncultured Caudovirales phage]CAB4179875.1 hypothetical protein UFOVP1035_93 [uncultured Caudovirales phage]CAB4188692.1 hypothetical protein UFOVP1181_52 [uncultured Caudovirales phage]
MSRPSRAPSGGIKALKRENYFDDFKGENTLGGEWVDKDGLTRDEAMEVASEEATRLDNIGGVYQRADRIITGNSEIEVTISNSAEMENPSMTDGKDIIFNANLIDDVNTDTIMSLNGLNYHEIAHVLYTPRVGSALGQFINANKMKRAFNVLEEGRIESLITSKYPSTALTLEAMVNDIILRSKPSEWGAQFPTVTGRKYLPIELRQAIADKFIEQYGVGLAKRVSAIVNEYRTLAFPTDFARAKELLTQFTTLVGQDDEPEPEWAKKPSGGGCGLDRDLPDKGRPKSPKEQGELQDNKPTAEEESLADKPSAPDKGEGDKAVEFGIGEGGTSREVYSGENRDLTQDDEAITKLLNARMKEIANDKSVARDVKDTRKAILNNTDINTKLPKATPREFAPRPSAKLYAQRFGRELERIVRDNDPAWNRFLPSGKLNISRTMNPDVNAIGEAFDVWDTGNDNTMIEASILIDNSGSMGSLMREVTESAWILKRGIESIEGTVGIYSFSSECKVIQDRDEKAKPNAYRYIESTGWTNPYRALLESERVLTASTKPNKIFFAVTDGQWGDEEACNKVIERMQKAGILCVIVFLSNTLEYLHQAMSDARKGDESSIQYMKSIAHGVDIFKGVTQAKDFLGLANEIIKHTLDKRER